MSITLAELEGFCKRLQGGGDDDGDGGTSDQVGGDARVWMEVAKATTCNL